MARQAGAHLAGPLCFFNGALNDILGQPGNVCLVPVQIDQDITQNFGCRCGGGRWFRHGFQCRRRRCWRRFGTDFGGPKEKRTPSMIWWLA